MSRGTGTILGGLPVYAVISEGKDADTPDGPGEYWAEVQEIRWLKKDGTPGKEIPTHIRDRAEKYDYGFCDFIQQVWDELTNEEHAPSEMVSFL